MLPRLMKLACNNGFAGGPMILTPCPYDPINGEQAGSQSASLRPAATSPSLMSRPSLRAPPSHSTCSLTGRGTASKVNSSCCPLRPRTTPFPEQNSILGLTYGVLLWADMNAATPLGAWGRSVISLGIEVHQGSATGPLVANCTTNPQFNPPPTAESATTVARQSQNLTSRPFSPKWLARKIWI